LSNSSVVVVDVEKNDKREKEKIWERIYHKKGIEENEKI